MPGSDYLDRFGASIAEILRPLEKIQFAHRHLGVCLLGCAAQKRVQHGFALGPVHLHPPCRLERLLKLLLRSDNNEIDYIARVSSGVAHPTRKLRKKCRIEARCVARGYSRRWGRSRRRSDLHLRMEVAVHLVARGPIDPEEQATCSGDG